MTSSEYETATVIPQPADKDTPWYTTIERIRSRLPSLEGNAGKTLRVSAGEDRCEWVTGGSGGSVAFADLIGQPSENPALKTVLDAKVNVPAGSTKPCSLGCDDDGPYIDI